MTRSRMLSEVATIVMALGLSTAAFAQAEPQVMPGEEPPVAAPPEESAQPAPAPEPAGADEYVVQEGDTLSGIAKKVTGDEANWSEIARENSIDDPTKLQVGLRLRIPAGLKSS